jgi:hypothetical protein
MFWLVLFVLSIRILVWCVVWYHLRYPSRFWFDVLSGIIRFGILVWCYEKKVYTVMVNNFNKRHLTYDIVVCYNLLCILGLWFDALVGIIYVFFQDSMFDVLSRIICVVYRDSGLMLWSASFTFSFRILCLMCCPVLFVLFWSV